MARRAFGLIAGLLVLGILVNSMLWYISLPDDRGLVGHTDLDLSTLVTSGQRTVEMRYGFEAYLHDVARGGTITVPDGDAVDRPLVESLSQMTVRVEEYNPRITQDRVNALAPDVELGGRGTVSGDGIEAVYIFLLADELPAPAVTYFTIGPQVYIIDDRLMNP